MLRQGGYLMIDDLQLHPVSRKPAEQPEFSLERDLGRSLVFRKTSAARQSGDWNQSPYIAPQPGIRVSSQPVCV
jgi:hypothetical protein